jgi:hypothetical protein
LVEIGFIGGIDLEQLAETGVESAGVKAASGGEFGSRVEDSSDDHGQDDIAVAAGNRVEDGIELQVAQAAENSGGVTVRKRAGDEEGIRQGRSGGWERAGQGQAEGIDLMRAEMGDIGESASLDFAVFAEGFAEEDGGRGVAIGDGSHIHAYIISQYIRANKSIITQLHAYNNGRENILPNQNKHLQLIGSENFGLVRAATTTPLRN